MTKTFASIELNRVDKHGLQAMMPLGPNAYRVFVWNFEFDSLEFV